MKYRDDSRKHSFISIDYGEFGIRPWVYFGFRNNSLLGPSYNELAYHLTIL